VSQVVDALMPAYVQLQADELRRPGELLALLLRKLHDPLLPLVTAAIAVAYACARIAMHKGLNHRRSLTSRQDTTANP
jgi:hypothetical protein